MVGHLFTVRNWLGVLPWWIVSHFRLFIFLLQSQLKLFCLLIKKNTFLFSFVYPTQATLNTMSDQRGASQTSANRGNGLVQTDNNDETRGKEGRKLKDRFCSRSSKLDRTTNLGFKDDSVFCILLDHKTPNFSGIERFLLGWVTVTDKENEMEKIGRLCTRMSVSVRSYAVSNQYCCNLFPLFLLTEFSLVTNNRIGERGCVIDCSCYA